MCSEWTGFNYREGQGLWKQEHAGRKGKKITAFQDGFSYRGCMVVCLNITTRSTVVVTCSPSSCYLPCTVRDASPLAPKPVLRVLLTYSPLNVWNTNHSRMVSVGKSDGITNLERLEVLSETFDELRTLVNEKDVL